MNEKKGCQTIGCSVKNCRYNDRGVYCELSRIEVRPCSERTGSGDPADESLCGNFRQK
ncbi:MAG: DUF1540 domain-containing protein [Clostridia bacterium]|nr:DUF1540 domain-containing protein [Clostridia bacterium]